MDKINTDKINTDKINTGKINTGKINTGKINTGKISRRIVTITIIETWTITWEDGTVSKVVYCSRQSDSTLPLGPIDPQGGNDLEAIATDSRQSPAIAQVEASAPPGAGPDVSAAEEVESFR